MFLPAILQHPSMTGETSPLGHRAFGSKLEEFPVDARIFPTGAINQTVSQDEIE